MCRINLINMPFGALDLPSLALTQLKSIIDTELAGRAAVDIHYLNLDFGCSLGNELYSYIADSADANNIGLGDWLFRHIAFPELPENIEPYFQRFFYRRDAYTQELKESIRNVRREVGDLLDDLIDRNQLDEADLTGFTSMFSQSVACFALARKLKERNPEMTVVIGGANCEAPMGQVIARGVDCVDFVFSGPALKSFPEFCRNFVDQELEKNHEISGVFSKKNTAPNYPDPVPIFGQELPLGIDVKLDYESYLDAYESKFSGSDSKPSLLFETSRGCWWGERLHCTFCGLNGGTMGYRGMDAEQALDQFQRLFAYAPRIESLESVDNIMPRNYPRDVFEKLETPKDIFIFYEVKANLKEREVAILSQARVKAIQPGIEALSTSTLRLMQKGSTVFTNLALLKNCALYAMKPIWNLLVGFPGEDVEVYKTYVEYMPQLYHLLPPSGVFQVRFDRFSPYFMQAKEYGLDLEPFDFYEMVYPFSKEDLGDLAYYFVNRNTEAEYFVNVAKWMGRMKRGLEAWNARWKNEDRAVAPRLFFKENGSSSIVYDSRSGEAVELDVGRVGREVLQMMTAKPKKAADLASELDHVPDFDAEQILSFLKDRKLVFQEQDRFMSLVLPREPPQSDVASN